MDKDNILDYFPEDAAGFKKDDVIILAKTFYDNMEAQMTASFLRTQNIPNYLIGDLEDFVGRIRLYIRNNDLEKARAALQELPEREKPLPQELKTINGYSPFNMMIYIFITIVFFSFLIFYFSQ